MVWVVAAVAEHEAEVVARFRQGGRDADIDEMDARGYGSAMEASWRRHIDAVRLSPC